jgi:hypothetical protein
MTVQLAGLPMSQPPIPATRPRRQNRSTGSTLFSPHFLLILGIGLLVVAIVIAIGYPAISTKGMEPAQVVVLAAVLGLATATFAAALPGTLDLRYKGLKAGGPIFVFLIVFYTVISAGAPGVLPDPISFYNRVRGSAR